MHGRQAFLVKIAGYVFGTRFAWLVSMSEPQRVSLPGLGRSSTRGVREATQQLALSDMRRANEFDEKLLEQEGTQCGTIRVRGAKILPDDSRSSSVPPPLPSRRDLIGARKLRVPETTRERGGATDQSGIRKRLLSETDSHAHHHGSSRHLAYFAFAVALVAFGVGVIEMGKLLGL